MCNRHLQETRQFCCLGREGELTSCYNCGADDFMEHMEDSEDEAAPRGYDDLAAAMAADGAEASTSDEEADDSGGEEHGESAGEGVESENGASGRSSGSGGSVESDAMFGDSSDEEDSDAGEKMSVKLKDQNPPFFPTISTTQKGLPITLPEANVEIGGTA